ncbi:MAG: hypothetical protein WC736_15170 [Gallionella sp.]|jgi:hypothetical protein
MTPPRNILRVFPRRTRATPDDGIVGLPSFWDEADEVHISVTFTEDRSKAEQLALEWQQVAPVKIGGPAYDDPGSDFTPGMYVKQGYVITSRGCPNYCWFCDAWKREGNTVRELRIHDGWNILDSNLLACSDEHVRKVFAMLKRQPRKAEFSGGLEAKRLKPWHVQELSQLKPEQLFFAYDTPDDLDPLNQAGKLLRAAGWSATSHRLRCYVLVGYRGDTQENAWQRMKTARKLGFWPMGMLYKDRKGRVAEGWKPKPFADVHEISKRLGK